MNISRKSNLIYFLYARKSSEGEDRQIQSIDDQMARLKSLSSALGLNVKEVFTEAKSAKKPHNRPVFTAMLKRIENGEANGILVWHLNRLSRNPVDSGTIGWMLQQGVLQSIQTIEKQYLPDDNVLLFSVESGMANQYIIELRKACMRGMDRKAELGHKPGMAPLGYVNDKESRTIKPDPARFTIVRKMWDLMLTGNYSPEAIRNIANQKWGFRTIRHKKMGDVPMPSWGIYNLFDNIFYTGMFRWKGQLYQGKHQPMISLAEYDKVQTLLKRKNNPRPQHHIFSYTGLIQCQCCNMMYTATEKNKLVKTTGKFQKYIYYHCSHKNKKIDCTNRPLSLSDIEKQIANELERYTIAPDFYDWAIKYIDDVNQNESESAKLLETETKKAMANVEKELENLTRMRYRDLIDDADFLKERTALKDQISKLQAQINLKADNSREWDELTKKAFHFAVFANHYFINGTSEIKRSIVSSFGSNYRILNGKLIFEPAFWLIPLHNGYQKIFDEYHRLELRKTIDKQVWNDCFKPLLMVWCLGPGSNW